MTMMKGGAPAPRAGRPCPAGVCCGLLCAVWWAPSLGAAQTPEEIKAIEAALAADVEAAPAPPVAPPARAAGGGGAASALNISYLMDVAGAWFNQAPEQLGGHDPADTGFTLQQLEMTLDGNVDHVFRLDGNVVFNVEGVEVEELYGSTLALPAGLKVRAGQFLTRMGRHNLRHPHAWSFLDQRLINAKLLGGDGSRGLGVELSWLAPLPWFVELSSSGTGALDACCARSFFGADEARVEGPGDLLYTTALRQFFDLSESWGLEWGVSTQIGPNAAPRGGRTEIYSTDLYLRFRPPASVDRAALSLEVEVTHRRRHIGRLLADTGAATTLVWNLNPRWDLGARYGWMQGLAHDPLDPDWTSDRRRASAQITVHPSHYSRLRLQASRDDLTWRADPIWAAMLGLELLIGAHGAHSY